MAFVRNRFPGVLPFLFLTFLLAWSIWIAGWLAAGRPATTSASRLMVAAIYAGSFAPGIAGGLLSGMAGNGALKEWLRAFIRFRCGWRAYAFALLPVPLTLLVLTVVLGYTPRLDKAHGLSSTAFYLTLFPISLFNGLATAVMGAGPLGEEGGWRGYLLPRVLRSADDLQASVSIGIVWTLWHLPMMLMFADWRTGVPVAAYLPLYGAGLIALSFIATAVWRAGGGSLVPCIWLHGLINAVGGVAFDHRLWSSRWSVEASTAHFSAAIVIAAVVLFVITRRSRLGRGR